MAKINVTSGPSSGGGGGGGNLQLLAGASMSSTLTAVTDTSNTQSPLKLSTTGVQTTSKLQITTADTNYIDAEDNSGNNRFTVGRDPSSQQVNVDFASNPTGSTTVVGAIRTYVDGVNLSEVMTFREDGNVGINTTTPGAKLDVHSAAATVAQFNKTGTGNSYIQQLLAGAAKWKHGFTGATGAFDIIDDVNALTRLSLLNTGQLKLNAYTSTSAFTGTTAGFLAFDSSGNILSVAAPGATPSGVAGSVQFSDGTNFASDATKFFWDNTNKRLGIGTNAPIAGPFQVKTTQSNANGSIIFTNNSAATIIAATDTGSALTLLQFRADNYNFADATNGVLIGGTYGSTPTARLQVKGSGSTSATTSLLVQNSSGVTGLTVFDNGNVSVGSSANSGYQLFGNGSWFNTGSIFSSLYYLTVMSPGAGGSTNLYGNSNNFKIGTSATATASAVFEVDSTTKGFLPPRMTTTQKNAIATPAAGLMVYDTTLNKLCVYTTAWETITSL